MSSLFKKVFVLLTVFCACGEKEPEPDDKEQGGEIEDGSGDENPGGEEQGKEEFSKEITPENINKWLDSLYKDLVVDKDIEIVEEFLDTGLELFSEIEHKKYINTKGEYTAPVVDTPSSILYFYYIDGVEYEYELNITIMGYSNPIDATEMWINSQMTELISYDYKFPTKCELYGTDIKWSCQGTEIVEGNLITLKGVEFEQVITFDYVVTDGDKEASKTLSIYVSALNDAQKAKAVFDLIKDKYAAMEITEDIKFETIDDLYKARISWKSWAEHIVTSNGKYIAPLQSQKIKFQVIVKMNKESYAGDIVTNVKGLDPETTWEKVEAFLEKINIKEVKNQKYNLYGWEEGYTTIPTRNYGYLPFYKNEDLKVTVDILPDGSPLKPSRNRVATKYITVHNTGMGHPTATAKGLNDYIHTTDRVASWHFAVDDYEAYQHLGLKEVGWHAGDGSHTEYWFDGAWYIGGGNNLSVGLENCVYYGCDYNMVMRNNAKLVSKLLVEFNLTTSDIRQHFDFSGKDCPQVLRQAGRWAEQLELIEMEYYGRTALKGVDFEWESLTPEIMDDYGRVYDTRPTDSVEVGYKVKVTVNGETKEFTYTSTLNKLK